MSAAEPSSEAGISINIKGPSELKLSIQIELTKTVRELKEAIAAKSDVEADRQRLIYSGQSRLSMSLSTSILTWNPCTTGRVMKDEDLLSTYKLQS